MLTFWLVTGLDDHRWEIIVREDGTRFHRKEGHVSMAGWLTADGS